MSAVDDAWQAALAAEQQAAYGYPLLGPRLPAAQERLAIQCSAAHEALRDSTTAAIAAAGRPPIAPQVDYPGLYPVPDAASARRLALRLEDACAAAWRFLFAQAARRDGAPAAARRRAARAAQTALTASAVRATQWRQLIDPSRASVAFPGTGP